METKDRIRQIMEDKHMTQQVFADFLQQSPATLSSIFNGRTRPTINVIESMSLKRLKQKFLTSVQNGCFLVLVTCI